MAETKKVAETKEGTDIAGSLERAIRAVAPPDLLKALEEVNKKRESKFIQHPDEVAVFEISAADLPNVDSIPGQFKVNVEPGDVDEKGEPVNPATEDGQRKVHVYQVVLSINPSAVKGGEFVVINKKEWIEAQKSRAGSMMSAAQEVASIMQRSGGVGDEV